MNGEAFRELIWSINSYIILNFFPVILLILFMVAGLCILGAIAGYCLDCIDKTKRKKDTVIIIGIYFKNRKSFKEMETTLKKATERSNQ